MSVIREKRVQTRKPCWCFGCNQEYPAGSVMRYLTWSDSDGINSYHWCDVCEALWQQAGFHYDDTVMRGEMYDSNPEAWQAVRAELEVATP